MLAYPSINRWQEGRGFGKPCIAFDKYDGSNIRFEWSPKRNWYKFGSRTQLLDRSNPTLGPAIDMFLDGMGKEIPRMVAEYYKYKPERLVAFAEFWGAKSFAGSHEPDDPKFLTLFDVSVYKKGFIAARKFVDLFGKQPWAAKVVYEGNMNQPFIDAVRHGQYNVNEGVICKGLDWSAKIKTFEFLNRLKNKYGDDWEKFGE